MIENKDRLLRVRSAGGAEPLCVAWWGPLTIVGAARAGAGGGVEGARVHRVRRADVLTVVECGDRVACYLRFSVHTQPKMFIIKSPRRLL
jgi:hypothetical protein